MTQEQAQEILATVNGKLEMKRLEAVNLLFRKIDELKMMEEDAQQYVLRCRNELEALRTKSCDGCKYYTSTLCPVEEFSITSAELEKHPFYCNRHKPKEQ